MILRERERDEDIFQQNGTDIHWYTPEGGGGGIGGAGSLSAGESGGERVVVH